MIPNRCSESNSCQLTEQPCASLENVSRIFRSPSGDCHALRGVDFAIDRGELVLVRGRSGCGKTTLIQVLAGIDQPTRGRVLHHLGEGSEATDLTLLSEPARSRFRCHHIGVVFQFFQLLPTLSVVENVALAMELAGSGHVGAVPVSERRDRALALLERVGVLDQSEKLPAWLSGGQQQRVAIARALANDPALLLADEPTGNLDEESAETVMQTFRDLVAEGRAVLVVSHDPDAARFADRTLRMRDGELKS